MEPQRLTSKEKVMNEITQDSKRHIYEGKTQSLAVESLGVPQHPLALPDLIKNVVRKCLRLVAVISNEIFKRSLLSYSYAIVITTLVTVCCTANVRN
jgi:hypothetical protein